MSRLEETVQLGRNAASIDLWKVERDSDAEMRITVVIPDVDGAIVSADTVDEGLCFIKANKADTTPLVVIGTGMDFDFMTISRPNPNQILIAIDLPPSVTNTIILQPEGIVATDARRYAVPEKGWFDIRLELASGKVHYVLQGNVQSDIMVTHPAQVPP